ncbi:TPA: hypothetical protein OW323_000255 [Pseudomonas aeruginosa]|nr:hypothetical protein [Pseudomonas aeruginosa]HCW0773163.1 hypothetical protein [Pseudomonas aeruginosa]
MTESKICTCPSGDGSLRWPCPEHPAVEQAGGDERAAFEAWMTWLMDHVYGRLPDFTLDDGSGAHYVNADVSYAWTAWQARAALAQPSPAQADEKPGDSILCYGCFAKGVGPDHFDEAGKCLAAQAEAKRPEVVGYRIMRAQADKIYQRVDKAAAEYEAGRSALGYMEDIAEAALCLRNRLDDLLAAPVAQAQHSVPEGWKLVPVEPTEDVLEAIHNGGYVGDDQELRWFYQSILAAAPAPGGE